MTEYTDVRQAQQAVYTSWGRDENTGNFVLVLHDEAGEAFAVACYSYDMWVQTFDNLRKKRQ